MVAYFDTSAFLKLIIPEPGSHQARETWLAADRRISSRLLYPESRAGMARAHRMGRVGRPGLEAARADVDAYMEDAVLLELTRAVAQHAGDLAEEHGLRAYDAVHLATVDAVADDDTVLIAADGELARAARAHGIATSTL